MSCELPRCGMRGGGLMCDRRNEDFNLIKLLRIIFRSNDIDSSIFWVLYWTRTTKVNHCLPDFTFTPVASTVSVFHHRFSSLLLRSSWSFAGRRRAPTLVITILCFNQTAKSVFFISHPFLRASMAFRASGTCTYKFNFHTLALDVGNVFIFDARRIYPAKWDLNFLL